MGRGWGGWGGGGWGGPGKGLTRRSVQAIGGQIF